ncbi:copper amine oxidase N-terminal domain-containing protein [Paenibacillus rhizovicinus]|uniref:Copper amine oxidase N-terminal domain-containing protein n=1 Tax=Paenibacillus rhizovicinus TaxID=2704463 RepID=A0A6C0P5X1_9BACL|nr:copper amine oxidase N-terminal domain-containing protein [Paenibacillus rhizovicinus]QHW33918.1 copper amine oxidase N-terminal domain-containing protein [Paenibacillus rhizovicinus]
MRTSKRRRLRSTAALLITCCLLVTMIFSPEKHVFAATAPVAASVEIGKTMAISINGFYVLFPGEQTPYLKSGRLMVPLRAFANAIGAGVLYDQKSRSATISALGEPVKGIRAGIGLAVYDWDLPLLLKPAPEIRNGIMFVPATTILQGLQTYGWEAMSGLSGTKTLVIKDLLAASAFRMVAALSDAEQAPFPVESTTHPYPYFPIGSTISEIKDLTGKTAYELTLKLQNSAGMPVPGNGSELEIHAVDAANKEISAMTLKGPQQETGKAQLISFHTTVPMETQFIVFRSRILK